MQVALLHWIIFPSPTSYYQYQQSSPFRTFPSDTSKNVFLSHQNTVWKLFKGQTSVLALYGKTDFAKEILQSLPSLRYGLHYKYLISQCKTK